MTTQEKMRRYTIARRILIFWCLFIGIGAVGGAYSMITDPSGRSLQMDAMLPYFQVLPFADVLFQDFTFSGYALLCVNGLTNLIAAALLLMKKKSGVMLGMLFGITLMLWIMIQFVVFPFNIMSTSFFIIGLAQACTGYAASVFYKQSQFQFDESEYSHIGQDSRKLVVYFSRMGYSRKKAYEIANANGAEIYEIRSTEMTDNTKGFWWCGRYGMHRWPMPIEPVSVDLSQYEQITIVSPIWVGDLAGPIKQFFIDTKGQIHHCNLVLVHHNVTPYYTARKGAEELAGIKMEHFTDICCQKGEYRTICDESR